MIKVILVILSVLVFFSNSLYCQDKKTEEHLKKELRDKEAIVWYLGHSGWAVRTKGYFLIFDYAPKRLPRKSSLSKGDVNPEELKDLNVIVFVTHSHSDHYNPGIFRWTKSLDDITYIIGGSIRVKKNKNIINIGARKEEKIMNLEVKTIKSCDDDGVGFLVKVDGLTVFHAGDHASWAGMNKEYTKEIDWLAESDKEIDLCFLPVYDDRTNEGAYYAIEKLSPKATFPMHCGWDERLYKEFAKNAQKKGIKAKIVPAEKKGDVFHYKEGNIE
jgi:L-ascorbate metabolism protein UlaG (beta-lactamase superfamily)